MKLDSKIAKLICELEYSVGNQCYNPSSYDGWTGEEGCKFRYPVYALNDCNSHKLYKFSGNVGFSACTFSADTINTMKYKFGANQLFIGKGIKLILEELERRYNLDFNELESMREQEMNRDRFLK